MARETIAPYNGPAPMPQRRISLNEGQDANADVVASGQVMDDNIVDTMELTPGIPGVGPEEIRRSPAPEDTGLASEVATLTRQVGELVNELGRKDEAYRMSLEEMQIRMEAHLATLGGNPSPALPEGIDPEAPVSIAQLTGILTNFSAMNQAAMIRASWNVTPEEEAKILMENPNFARLSEPTKTLYIKRVADLRRTSLGRANESGSTAGSTVGNGHTANPETTLASRPGRPTVPAVETGYTPTGDIPVPGSALRAAQKEYEDAKKIPDRKARLAAMKAAFNKILAVQRIPQEAIVRTSWNQT